jgi:hypothetical protein
MTTLGNNGNQLAEMMHNEGLIVNGFTLEQCEIVAKEQGIITTEQQLRWIKNDDFWEDFCYRCEELGYKLHV